MICKVPLSILKISIHKIIYPTINKVQQSRTNTTVSVFADIAVTINIPLANTMNPRKFTYYLEGILLFVKLMNHNSISPSILKECRKIMDKGPKTL